MTCRACEAWSEGDQCFYDAVMARSWARVSAAFGVDDDNGRDAARYLLSALVSAITEARRFDEPLSDSEILQALSGVNQIVAASVSADRRGR